MYYITLIDTAHAQDPATTPNGRPAESLYADRIEAWVARLIPSASPLLLLAALVFIVANLAMGITFSTIARNQLQAVQMSFFAFLPSILLGGFMFPFRGMPVWAQYLGEVLPITHFLRIVRGIMLKGNGMSESLPEFWPIVLFCVVALTIAVKRYRQTLD